MEIKEEFQDKCKELNKYIKEAQTQEIASSKYLKYKELKYSLWGSEKETKTKEEKRKIRLQIKQLEKNTTYVYILFNPLNNLFKIGKTEHIKPRLANIRTISGIHFILMVRCDINIQSLENTFYESILHKFFKSKRRIGEWFELNKIDLYALCFSLEDFHCKVHINKELFDNDFIVNKKYNDTESITHIYSHTDLIKKLFTAI